MLRLTLAWDNDPAPEPEEAGAGQRVCRLLGPPMAGFLTRWGVTRKEDTMELAVPGIHHVTAIAGDPQQNIDFYTQVLGMRLVKVTVNYDDPGTYHFYFGSQMG